MIHHERKKGGQEKPYNLLKFRWMILQIAASDVNYYARDLLAEKLKTSSCFGHQGNVWNNYTSYSLHAVYCDHTYSVSSSPCTHCLNGCCRRSLIGFVRLFVCLFCPSSSLCTYCFTGVAVCLFMVLFFCLSDIPPR